MACGLVGVPLLSIAPSKTDAERLLVISPELADVLSAIITRIRRADETVPLAAAYDTHERTWNPPMPLLFQRPVGLENRPIPIGSIRDILTTTLAAAGIALLIANGTFLRRDDFTTRFIDHRPASVTFPTRARERRILLLSASLVAGIAGG